MIAEYAARILALGDEMAERVRSLDRSSRSIAFGSDAPGPILHFKAEFARRFPEQALAYEQKERSALIAGLKAGEYLFIILSAPLKERVIDCRECLTENLMLSVLPAHPAAAYESVSFSDMGGASFFPVGQHENPSFHKEVGRSGKEDSKG